MKSSQTKQIFILLEKEQGIGNGGEVELGARDDEAMKISMWAISEVRGGKVRRRSVRHDHALSMTVKPGFY